VKRARCFPDEVASCFVEGDDARAAEFAFGKVGVVIESEDEEIALEDWRAGGAVEVFWCGDWLFPEFVSGEVVADEAVGTEVDVETFEVGGWGRSGRAVEVVDWLDGNFGRGATPEKATGLRGECKGDEAIGFESGEKEFIAGDDGRGEAGWNGYFPGESVGGDVGWRFGGKSDAGAVWAAEAGPA
jgi:hypothetical protein